MSNLKKAPSVLAFERKLDISDAVFFQKNSTGSEIKAVVLNEKAVRGTISNRLKNIIVNDPAKLDAEIEKANLQRVDAAALNPENDTLIVKWSLKVLPFKAEPNVCNDQAYQARLKEKVQEYLKDETNIQVIAARYAMNIANARWLWRNRVGAESIQVTVKFKDERLGFDAKALPLSNFETTNPDLEKLTKWISDGLLSKEFVILYISAEVKVGYGQEVYPSQELVLDTGSGKGTKSKILYAVDGKAGMHSQKIGNAIRTIDTWYPAYVDNQFPIAIEPYGAVTTLGKAFRNSKDSMFYSLFDDWIIKNKDLSPEQQHYVIAVLLRGGVFGESGKE